MCIRDRTTTGDFAVVVSGSDRSLPSPLHASQVDSGGATCGSPERQTVVLPGREEATPSPHQTGGTTVKEEAGDTLGDILILLKKAAHHTTQTDRFHNPDPLVRMVGRRNEGDLEIAGVQIKALLDTGAQISTISEKWCSCLLYTSPSPRDA